MAEALLNYSDSAVALLKANIGFFDSEIPAALDEYLRSLLEKAYSDFTENAEINLKPGKLSDDFDQATYAAYLYRNGSTGAGKTEMLKSIIRNRQVNQALKSPEGSA